MSFDGEKGRRALGPVVETIFAAIEAEGALWSLAIAFCPPSATFIAGERGPASSTVMARRTFETHLRCLLRAHPLRTGLGS